MKNKLKNKLKNRSKNRLKNKTKNKTKNRTKNRTKNKSKNKSKKREYLSKRHNNKRRTYKKTHIKHRVKRHITRKKKIKHNYIEKYDVRENGIENSIENNKNNSFPSETPKPSLEDLEIQMLHKAMEEATEKNPHKLTYSSEIKDIIQILEDFIREKKLICYGGTAINNILPNHDQFYNKEVEIPDYDVFSPIAMKDVKEMADLFYKKGYNDVEAKAGIHEGTYKLFVNFIHVADVTQQDLAIFNNLNEEAITINGIKYAPPNFLRLYMFLELSRPKGDITRWEKVLRRLFLLNKHYPLTFEQCNNYKVMKKYNKKLKVDDRASEIVRNSLINQDVVFFGGYAMLFYSKFMSKFEKKIIDYLPDYDVLAEDPLVCATILKERLMDMKYNNVKIEKKLGMGDIIPEHHELIVDGKTLCFVYKPLACHSYNTITLNGLNINIASIETMLSFYLAFLYVKRPYYDIDRIVCMAQFLFIVLQKHRLASNGVLKRFSTDCYGRQVSWEDAKSEKSRKFMTFIKENQHRKDYKKDPVYERNFLNYKPYIVDERRKKNNHKKRR